MSGQAFIDVIITGNARVFGAIVGNDVLQSNFGVVLLSDQALPPRLAGVRAIAFDPSVIGEGGARGTVALRTDVPQVWQKTADAPDTAWALVGGGGPSVTPEIFSIVNTDAAPIVAGMPVTSTGKLGSAAPGSGALAQLVGLALAGAAPGFAASVQGGGALTLAAAVWDAVTGQVGGLTVGGRYWLDVGAGALSVAAPTAAGDWVVSVGEAITSTTMIVSIAQSVLI